MTTKKNPNMALWDEVCTTDPSMTKQANVRGNKITAIAPQSQIKQATEQFGSYGSKWGFKTVHIDYTLMEKGLVTFKGEFYYPGGEFEIFSSIGIYKDNAHTKIDDDFAKKVETDTLTKALSKIGFNADIFLGKYEDSKYVTELWDEKQREDDANIISEEQLSQLQESAEMVGADVGAFCKYLQITSLESMPESKFKQAVSALEKKRK